ncbi:Phospholipase A1 EG1, chloroplastic/mitochondrial [Gracilariopsis chorda]|uniref:Phospholipase A1 EG1, chloroplastic/mitochondrial n=1 Tax=Gracilariopsis chorda TaxID=448386 RepID=A0A2V3IY72_9FLOR|nr:Phospholipase A1 EG1, chloroplastic/mitochondrial [Gracilariopsis chorda]|eukprot:PXF47059.1 Phospholipase A1 EG1, chloroplastic/mitochondrial [Gracilariopsis chorda]
METHSSSLPSHFRFHSSPPSPFFTAEPDDPASSVPSVDVRSAKTRLEVLKGWEVNFSVLCLYFASAVALAYIFVKLRVTATVWHESSLIPALNTVESVFMILLQAASVALPVFYLASLYAAPTVTDEQIWTCIVLSVALLVSNPLTRIAALAARSAQSLSTADDAESSRVLYFPLDVFSNDQSKRLIISDSVYTAAIYLYLILSAHSYRVFDVKSLHTLSFYAPKVAIALFFFIVKLVAGFKAGISLGLVPYSRLLTWFILYKGDRHSLRVTVPVIITTVLDTAFAFWLVTEVARTAEFLATVPYVENRAKQLGFRCYVFQTLAFCGNMIGLSLLVTFMLPQTYIYDAYDSPPANFLQLEPPVARLGLAFVYFTWNLVIAYVNLPPQPIIPFARRIVLRVLYLLRNSRVAGWLGLADIDTTEEPEDFDEAVDNRVEIRAERDTIPLRYRHREMFDFMLSSPQHPYPLSPDTFSSFPPIGPPCEAVEDPSKYGSWDFAIDTGRRDISFENSTHQPSSLPRPIDIDRSTPRRSRSSRTTRPSPPGPPSFQPFRLRLRKNLFVMETQVVLANATYLSYIPGNPKEELREVEQGSSLQHICSLSGLEQLARHSGVNSNVRHSHPSSSYSYGKLQPCFDDGSMFLVNPYEMAQRYEYKLHKHFYDERLNTHAIILLSSTRVIVAFSGTRNVTNWGVNANVRRAVLDEKLSKFEYELSSDSATDHESESDSDEPKLEALNNRAVPMGMDLDDIENERIPLRRTRSEDAMVFWMDDIEWDGSRQEPDLEMQLDNGYGAVPTFTRAKTHPRTTPRATTTPTAPTPPARGSRTTEGVSMVARTLARELMTFGQAKVHEGFIDAYMSLRKQVMGSLIELYRGKTTSSSGGAQEAAVPSGGVAKTLPLFFCGHSLGGALATFASYEAARYYKRIGLNRRQDVSCTTFGCPRLGNEAFKARYEGLVETHWRFEIASDPIPKVPSLFLNYVPVGVQVLMDQSGMLLIDPSFIEVQWWGQLSNWYMGYRLHIRASYCMALRTYCKMYKNGADDLADKFWPFPLRVQTKGLFRHVYR